MKKRNTFTSILAGIGCLTLIFLSCGYSSTNTFSNDVPVKKGETYKIRMVSSSRSAEMKILENPLGDWLQVEWAGEPTYININNIMLLYKTN